MHVWLSCHTVTQEHLRMALVSLSQPPSQQLVDDLLQSHKAWLHRHSQAITQSCQLALEEAGTTSAGAGPPLPFIQIPPIHSFKQDNSGPASPARSVASASSFSTQWSSMSRGGPAGTAQLLEDLHQGMAAALEKWKTTLAQYQVSWLVGLLFPFSIPVRRMEA